MEPTKQAKKKRVYTAQELLTIIEQGTGTETSSSDEEPGNDEFNCDGFRPIGLMFDVPCGSQQQHATTDLIVEESNIDIPVVVEEQDVSFDTYDKDYDPDTNSSDSSDDTDFEAGKEFISEQTEVPKSKRNKRAKPETWKNNIIKAKRLKGEEHESRRGILHREKHQGLRCQSKFCQKSVLRHCNKFTEDDRNSIWTSFYNMKSWDERKSVVKALVSSVEIKQRKSSTNKRSSMFEYCLRKKDGSVYQVCKQMFCSTLGMASRTITDWLTCNPGQVNVVDPEKEITDSDTPNGKHWITKKMSEETVTFLKVWLLNVPCVESHYCRKVPAYKEKRFLEPGTKVISLFERYQHDASEASKRAVGFTYFKKVFADLKMSIFMPRKDQCDACIGAKLGTVSNEQHQKHISSKDEARKRKSDDKDRAMADDTVSCWTMDTQAVQLCPQTKASTMYYRTKLQVHNFTLHNMKTHDGYCYVWDETNGDLASEVFASLQYKHFKQFIDTNKHITELIIWSDGCGYQNKNCNLASVYVELSKETGVVIYQKYLVSGHTNMECDSMHSCIESNIIADIYTPRDLVMIMITARRKPRPYIVQEMIYSDFLKLAEPSVSSIRPGKKVGDPTVSMASMYRYAPDNTIHYRLFSATDEVWKPLPIRIRILETVARWDRIFENKRCISARKYDDLQVLKRVLPQNTHSFYDNLPHE